MTANEQLASVGKNIQEKATLIWNVANTLFGAFKPHEYGLVSLKVDSCGTLYSLGFGESRKVGVLSAGENL